MYTWNARGPKFLPTLGTYHPVKFPVDKVSPKARRKREEEALNKERQCKKRRLANAHKVLRTGGSVHDPIEIAADHPPNIANLRIKGEMAQRRFVMRELYHFDIDTAIHLM